MMRKGFTLIELIFVIVVIGILSVVALPKFTNLKQNAEVSNMIKAYTALTTSGSTAYLNATELNGIPAADVNITTLMKISPIKSTGTHKGWELPYPNREDYVRYYLDGTKYMQFYINNTGTVSIFTYIAGNKKTEVQSLLNKKLGLTFSSDRNTTLVDLTSE